MQSIAAYPDQIPQFVELGIAEHLLPVLEHQNVDICIESITLLVELTDEEMATE